MKKLLCFCLSLVLIMLFNTNVWATTTKTENIVVQDVFSHRDPWGIDRQYSGLVTKNVSITSTPTSVYVSGVSGTINHIRASGNWGYLDSSNRILCYNYLIENNQPHAWAIYDHRVIQSVGGIQIWGRAATSNLSIGTNASGYPTYDVSSMTANNLIPNTKWYLGYARVSESLGMGSWGHDIWIEDIELTNRMRFRFTVNKVINSTSIGSGMWAYSTLEYIDVYTAAARPILSAQNIRDTKLTINWNANGNPTGTSYTLQRRVPGQAWTNRYTGTLNTFTDTGLNNETTYDYRVIVNHIAGTSWNTTSWQNGLEHLAITTTADPAVAAAQEAALRAAAAEEASFGAQTKAQEVYDLVNSLDLGDVKNDVAYLKATMSTPFIQQIKSQNNATATFGSNFVISVSAAGNQANLRYRAICDNFDSGWTNSKTINITGLHDAGIKNIQVFVSNYPEDPDSGSIAMKEFTFFKL